MGSGTPARASCVSMVPSWPPPPTTTPLVYVESDVPEGMTLAEWRRSRRRASASYAGAEPPAAGATAPCPRDRAGVIAYLIYEGARLLTAGSYPSAFGQPSRSSASSATSASTSRDRPARVPALAAADGAQLRLPRGAEPGPAGVADLLYRLNRATYHTLRNTLLATWLLALPVYALFPAAPPRLSGLGIADTVSSGSPLKMESGTTTSLVNQFAAVPSLHVGFAFAIGIALAAALRARSSASPRCCGARSSCFRRRDRQPLHLRRGGRATITVAGYGVGRLAAGGWPARHRPGLRAWRTPLARTGRRRVVPALSGLPLAPAARCEPRPAVHRTGRPTPR